LEVGDVLFGHCLCGFRGGHLNFQTQRNFGYFALISFISETRWTQTLAEGGSKSSHATDPLILKGYLVALRSAVEVHLRL